MSKRKYSPENPCTNELQTSIFDSSDQKLTSNIFDEDGKEIEIGDKIQLTFNEGEFSEHKAIYKVVWKDAAYKIVSEDTGNESFLGSISHSVKLKIN